MVSSRILTFKLMYNNFKWLLLLISYSVCLLKLSSHLALRQFHLYLQYHLIMFSLQILYLGDYPNRILRLLSALSALDLASSVLLVDLDILANWNGALLVSILLKLLLLLLHIANLFALIIRRLNLLRFGACLLIQIYRLLLINLNLLLILNLVIHLVIKYFLILHNNTGMPMIAMNLLFQNNLRLLVALLSSLMMILTLLLLRMFILLMKTLISLFCKLMSLILLNLSKNLINLNNDLYLIIFSRNLSILYL